VRSIDVTSGVRLRMTLMSKKRLAPQATTTTENVSVLSTNADATKTLVVDANESICTYILYALMGYCIFGIYAFCSIITQKTFVRDCVQDQVSNDAHFLLLIILCRCEIRIYPVFVVVFVNFHVLS